MFERTGKSLAAIFLIAVALVGIGGVLNLDSLPGGLALWTLALFFVGIAAASYVRTVREV